MIKKLISILLLSIVTGCSGELSGSSDDAQKEYILTQLNDYQGLIEIYRDKLSTRDNPQDRYYLSELYNKTGDFSSSNIYLQPLLEFNPESRYLVLHVKNLLELGREKECEGILKKLLANNTSSGELWNLQGVLFAQEGKYDQAVQSFTKARGLFYNEELVINNLAMMEILQMNYAKARDQLLDLYSRKKYQSQTVYNLVYTLAKTNDDESARKIIIDEKLTTSEPYKLIRDLKAVSPRKQPEIIKVDVAANIQDEVGVGKVDKSNPARPPKLIETGYILPPAVQNDVVQANDKLQCIPLFENKSRPDPFVGKIVNAKLISGLSSRRVNDGNVIELHSTHALNYIVLPSKKNNQLKVKFFNSMPSKNIYASQLSILKKNPGISNIEFYNNGDNSATLLITAKQCIFIKDIKRSTGNKKHKETLLIEFVRQ